MTEEKFSELVNLYLDKEISAADLQLLKIELSRNSIRKADFHERCRLHQAMRLALAPRPTKPTKCSSGGRRRSEGRARHRARAGNARTTVSSDSEVVQLPQGGSQGHFPRWLIGSGLAACLVLGLSVLGMVVMDRGALTPQTLARADQDPFGWGGESMSEVSDAELKRFALNLQERERYHHASLAAQFRLLGLRPEMVPEERQLREVSLASLRSRLDKQRELELFDALEDYSLIPRPRELEPYMPGRSGKQHWPEGFQTSLASF